MEEVLIGTVNTTGRTRHTDVTECAWCGEPAMYIYACPNAGDLCLDCCGEEH